MSTPDDTPVVRGSRRLLRLVLALLIAFGAVLGALLIVSLIPVGTSGLGAHPHPTTTYDQAVAAFDAYAADETKDGVVADCHSGLYTHGQRTENVIVLFHGLTNCPEQMKVLAQQLEAQGANVVVLRAPGHGLASGPDGLDGIEAEQFRAA